MKEIGTAGRTAELLKKYGFSFKKSLGQNFLIDPNILKGIVHHAGLDHTSYVIEIGPGIGALTEQLAQQAGHVLAVEIDQRLIPILQESLSDYTNVEMIHADFLKLDLKKILKEKGYEGQPLHIVANLPYYITTPIIMKVISSGIPFEAITVMMQKEVANRIEAKPGTKDYGSLSIVLQYYTEAKIVMMIPKTVFIPQPNVDSAIVRLTSRKTSMLHLKDENVFFAIVRASFAQRRKTLANNLGRYAQTIGMQREQLLHICENIGIDTKRRGETLSPEEYERLANAVFEMLPSRDKVLKK